MDLTPAVLPAPDRVHADRSTQAAYDAWLDGARYVARLLRDSTFEKESFREKIRRLAGTK
jgi:hypothetical protein